MKAALIGSSNFPVVHLGPAIVEFIKKFPSGTIVLTRGSKGFDMFVGECARLLGYEVVTYPGKGGAANFERDVALAREADAVFAFFEESAISQGGTQHVVEKALDIRKRVESYTHDGGVLVLVGSDAGSDQPHHDGRHARSATAVDREEETELSREEGFGPPVW